MSSWSKPVSLTDAINQLDSAASLRQLYSALVAIRTNYSKSDECVTTLRHHGGIEKLLNVLTRKIDTRCQDVILSILANCCVNENARLRVLKSANGIATLCNIVREAEKESIQNRGCRMLGNLCQTPACCDVIHEDHADVLDTLFSSLRKTEDRDCKITYCRTIRMLSDTEEHREALLSHGALKAVASVLHSSDSCLLLSGIRTISCFINNCSEEATRQLVSEGALESIVALTSHTGSNDVVDAAVSLLLSVASNAPSLRQYLGRAGAVEYFIQCLEELVPSDKSSSHKYCTIDALCHCCRDANNRIKIRENGGLAILMDVLSDSKFTNIHDRIISTLICFLYDDTSIAVLLQCSLVPTLISHLYRVAAIAKNSDIIGFGDFSDCGTLKSELYSITDASCEDDLHTAEDWCEVANDVNGLSSNCTFSVNCSVGKADAISDDSEPLFAFHSDNLNADYVPAVSDHAVLTVTDKSVVSTLNPDISTALEDGINTSRYSINSPTYKAVSAWRMELTDAEESTSDLNCPRNIWEGARLYAEDFSTLSRSRSFCGSTSPARSLGSCSDGVSSVRSWSSSLYDASPQKSPAVSPSWSVDSCGSGIYSPFSNTSYVYPDGACSPSSFSNAEDTEPACVLECDSQLAVAAEVTRPAHLEDGSASENQEREHGVGMSDSSCSVNVVELPAIPTSLSDAGVQTDTVDLPRECFLNVGSTSEGEVAAEVQSKPEGGDEDEANQQWSDEEFDIESFQRKREDERKLSRLLDIANSMYASIDAAPVIHSLPARKRKCSSSVTSVSPRHKSHCLDCPNEIETTSPIKATKGQSDLQVENVMTSYVTSDDAASCPVTVSQCRQVMDESSNGEMNSDSESKALSDISVHSGRHQRIGLVTERNILALLSRISHWPDTIAHVMNVGTICGLLDYTQLAASPLTAANRILLRLSLSHDGFQRALLCLFPIHAACRIEADWLVPSQESDVGEVHSIVRSTSSADCVGTDRAAPSFKQKTAGGRSVKIKMNSSYSCCSLLNVKSSSNTAAGLEDSVSRLCSEVIANLAILAVSRYGQGVISHLLLRGNRHQRERCVCSIFILCQNSEMRRKFLVEMHAVDILTELLRTPNSPLFKCAVLALSYQAKSLNLASFTRQDRDAVEDSVASIDDDVVFVLDDGSQVPASRRVMSSGSDVFAAMLGGTFREAAERHVRIPAAPSAAFRTMVAWLHGQRPSTLHLDDVCGLIPLYHRFQIPDDVRRRSLLTPLVTSVFDTGDDDEGKFARTFRLLSVYDDVGSLRRDMVVALLTRRMSLRRRCSAVSGVVSDDTGTDVELLSVITAVLLDAMD